MSDRIARDIAAEEAYLEDVRRHPFYVDRVPRKTWDDLDDLAKETWRRNPTPRAWRQKT